MSQKGTTPTFNRNAFKEKITLYLTQIVFRHDPAHKFEADRIKTELQQLQILLLQLIEMTQGAIQDITNKTDEHTARTIQSLVSRIQELENVGSRVTALEKNSSKGSSISPILANRGRRERRGPRNRRT